MQRNILEVKVMKKTNEASIGINPYCYKIAIKRDDRNLDIMVSHKSRKL